MRREGVGIGVGGEGGAVALTKPRTLDAAQAYEAHLLFRTMDKPGRGLIKRADFKKVNPEP